MTSKIKILCLFLALFLTPVLLSAQPPTSTYLKWLTDQSMLREASTLAQDYVSGKGSQWQHSYEQPQTQAVLQKASVWFTAYPGSTITKEGESVLQTLGNAELWQTFKKIGIEAMHTGPLKKAGGIVGENKYTPTVDGWFDRITLNIDPLFGTESEYKNLVRTAQNSQAILIGDIIPGHTGKGADFRLAEMAYQDYPGLYTMVEIETKDWSLLPKVPSNQDSVNLSSEQVDVLTQKGYLPGHLQRVLFSVPGKTGLTGWDATKEVMGPDNKYRRWVYLHYFKPGQPTLNWLDPSFAAQRLISGDIIKTKTVLGASIIRLDANPFLGIEPQAGTTNARSESTYLSLEASNMIAQMMRKLGGWSFQELNLGFNDIQAFATHGPDLSYDFVTRPAYQHALLTGNAAFLKLNFSLLKQYSLKSQQFIHALQNHDEITYELVHFQEHADTLFDYRGKQVSGAKIRNSIQAEMEVYATTPRAPYNQLSGNGLCTTSAGLAAAALNIQNPYQANDQEKANIQKAHVLMVMYNAFLPGVFAISGWDLVGALPLPVDSIKELVKDGDYRWINRGAYDLMDVNSKAKLSNTKLPKATSLYGSLPEQLKKPGSFVSQLKNILALRKKYQVHIGQVIDIPVTKDKGLFIMINKLPDNQGFLVTALNFGQKKIMENVKVRGPEGTGLNLLKDEYEWGVSYLGDYYFELEPLEAKAIFFATPKRSGDSNHSG